MAKEIIVPQIGQDIDSGILQELYIKPGDYVKKGDLVAAVESDKATFEIEAYDSGYVIEILNDIGDEVKVLAPIIYLGDKDESVEPTKIEKKSKDYQELVQLADKSISSVIKDSDIKIKASPLARRIASEHNIDYRQVKGTGPNGRIIKKDILEAIDKKSDTDSFGQVDTVEAELQVSDQKIILTKMRRKIAERLEESKQTIPHFYIYKSVDITHPLVLRKKFNQTSSVKISINDLIIKATSQALLKFPRLNSHFTKEEIIQKSDINIGIAVSVEDGLLVPVMANADRLTIPEIAHASQELTIAARKGILKSKATGTFTVSNLGMHGIDLVFPIINPPECGILGVGSVEKRVIPLENNAIGIREYMTLSLACDHRIIDGVYAAKFLMQLKENLEMISI